MRVLSPGNGGSVSQSNNASSNAIAGNANWTGQNAAQSQGSGKEGCCGSGIQAIGQSSHNWQGAAALGITLQLGPRQPCKCQPDSQIGNSNTPTRVLSPGDDGSVRQSNERLVERHGGELNATRQAATQIQTRPVCGCRHSAGIQAIGQQGLNGQNAAAFAASLQLGAIERVGRRTGSRALEAGAGSPRAGGPPRATSPEAGRRPTSRRPRREGR